MSTHKHFDKICCVIVALTLVITVAFINGEKLGIKKMSSVMGYESKIFDTSRVHELNIVMDNWDTFISNCKNEEYYKCTVVIDNEPYKNVAIRGKGNTSLTQVESYGNNRYSFKIEFDRYDSSKTYYGLDKLCLNNIIQDNTYVKDYLCYQMMLSTGVAAPLCSYVHITVNGEDWGLYLAVEGIEEAFLQRNYGKNYGNLYKPDSQNMGGGRGNGEDFNIENFLTDSENADFETDKQQNDFTPETFNGIENQPPDKNGDNAFFGDSSKEKFGNNMINGNDDVLLKYTDDSFESYSNIFDNAKTNITDSDKTRLIKSLKKLLNQEDIESTVDVEAVINYFAVHNFVLNFDSYTGSMIHNYYLYENSGQLQMIPWDYNLAFGGFNSSDNATRLINYPIDEPVSDGDIESRPMLAWIFSNEEYTELYHIAFAEFISNCFESGYFENMMTSTEEMISPYVEKDITKFCTYSEFKSGISTLKEFCLLRAESVAAQLDGTIGTTSATQKTDTLIGSNGITISDMGSMHNSNGMGGKGEFLNKSDAENGEPPENLQDKSNLDENAKDMQQPDLSGGQTPQIPNGKNFDGDLSADENQNRQNNGGTIPQKPGNTGENALITDNAAKNNTENFAQENHDIADMPNGKVNYKNDDNSSAQNGVNNGYVLVLLIVSAAVLVAGIVFAKRFK